MKAEYIQEDSEGYLYNSEFKPNFTKNGDKYHGYKSNNEEALFYYFAVLGYDLSFEYNGKSYYFLSCEDYVSRSDSSLRQDFDLFNDGNDMIKTFMIGNEHLIDIVDKLQNVDIL